MKLNRKREHYIEYNEIEPLPQFQRVDSSPALRKDKPKNKKLK